MFGMFGKKNIETTKTPQRTPVGAQKVSSQKKQPKEKVIAYETEKTERQVAIPKAEGHSAVLLGMRVTEKASVLSESASAYTFNVSADANKNMVSDAVEKLYKVHPIKVHIVTVPAKRVFVRGKRGVKHGGRKAYVYLKKGEKIEIS